ncbi:hypothetical protein AAXE64_08480 [Priestia megaterium]
MPNEYFEEIESLTQDIKDSDDANQVLYKIEDYYDMNYITDSQKERLESSVHSECMINGVNLGIDDYDWEEMCLYNPDLKD